MSKELEAKNLQANFIKCFNELLTKTDKDIFVVNISREMAQDMVNLYEKYLTIKPSEALKDLNEIIEYITEDKKVKYKATILFDCKIIKDALQKSQEMEKELEEVKADLTIELHNKKNAIEMYKEGQILRKEQEKVLEIILKKRVDIASFKAIVAVHPKKAKEYYNESMGFNTRRILKQEEFDLLKRWANE